LSFEVVFDNQTLIPPACYNLKKLENQQLVAMRQIESTEDKEEKLLFETQSKTLFSLCQLCMGHQSMI
jgi:hypothetical protein